MDCYVYRFINVNEDVIYIGATKDLDKRFSGHFSPGGNGHLPHFCYFETVRVEYAKIKSRADMLMYEIYFINKYQTKYNKRDKYEEGTQLELPDLTWKPYRFNNREVDKLKIIEERTNNDASSSKERRKRTSSSRKMRIWLHMYKQEKDDLKEIAEKKGLTLTTYVSNLIKETIALPHINAIPTEPIQTKESNIHIKISIEEHYVLKQYARSHGITVEQACFNLFNYSKLSEKDKFRIGMNYFKTE